MPKSDLIKIKSPKQITHTILTMEIKKSIIGQLQDKFKFDYNTVEPEKKKPLFMRIDKALLLELKKLKTHPKESYSSVIRTLLQRNNNS